MRMNSPLWLALAAGTALGALAGCQTYDFEPVTPLIVEKEEVVVDVAAAPPKPNMMLLVDKSGSMDDPINTSDPDCGSCEGDDCNQATCPTRWAEMRKAMDGFLKNADQGGQIARYGLTFFPEPHPDTGASPTAKSCSPTRAPRLKIDVENGTDDATKLQTRANQIFEVINGIKSPGPSSAPTDTGTGGGTPTSKSLRLVGGLPELNDAEDGRQDIVLLLTDGRPNCNDGHTGVCQCDQGLTCTGELATSGCLDEVASIDAVKELNKDKNIKTVVIGFGADATGGVGGQIMNEMAAFGGLSRRCDENGSCGAGDTCNPTAKVCGGPNLKASGFPCAGDTDCPNTEKCEEAPVCNRAFYAAANSAELSAALADIAKSINTDICEFSLAKTPEDMNLLIVKLNDQKLAQGADTWEYRDGKVVFLGSSCATIQAGNSQTPAKVNIQLVTPG